jgi:hypothetical protein
MARNSELDFPNELYMEYRALSMAYYRLRMVWAWKQENIDVASLMLDKAIEMATKGQNIDGNSEFNSIEATTQLEDLGYSVLEISEGMLMDKQYRDAIIWLEKIQDLLQQRQASHEKLLEQSKRQRYNQQSDDTAEETFGLIDSETWLTRESGTKTLRAHLLYGLAECYFHTTTSNKTEKLEAILSEFRNVSSDRTAQLFLELDILLIKEAHTSEQYVNGKKVMAK